MRTLKLSTERLMELTGLSETTISRARQNKLPPDNSSAIDILNAMDEFERSNPPTDQPRSGVEWIKHNPVLFAKAVTAIIEQGVDTARAVVQRHETARGRTDTPGSTSQAGKAPRKRNGPKRAG